MNRSPSRIQAVACSALNAPAAIAIRIPRPRHTESFLGSPESEPAQAVLGRRQSCRVDEQIYVAVPARAPALEQELIESRPLEQDSLDPGLQERRRNVGVLDVEPERGDWFGAHRGFRPCGGRRAGRAP